MGEKAKKILLIIHAKIIKAIPVKFSTTLTFPSGNFKFFQFSMNCPQRWETRKIMAVEWKSMKKNSSELNCMYIEIIPVKISTTLVFRPGTSINSIFDELSTEMKMTKSQKNLCNGENFQFRDFRLKIRLKTFWIDSHKKSTKKFRLCHFFTSFGRKSRLLRVLGQKFEKKSPLFKKIHFRNFKLSQTEIPLNIEAC